MSSRRVRIVAAAVAVIAMTEAGRARAADANVFPVEIAGSDKAHTIELTGPSGHVRCGHPCKLEIERGRYQLVVTDTAQHIFSEWLEVAGPMRIAVAPANQSVRVAGATMFVVGLAGAAAGAALTGVALYGHGTSGLQGPNGCERDCETWKPWAIAGGITLAASVAVGVTGLVLWRRNRRAVISEAPILAPPSTLAQWRLAPVAGARWTGLAMSATF